jgi:endoglucanase
VGVHCGEGGTYNKTPHGVFLAWLRDVLDILKGHNIGFALWNFRGSFGVLDSERADVEYEDFHGHKLDRKLLSLLEEF